MSENELRDAIANELIYHRLAQGGRSCLCGYVYPLGVNIMEHRADKLMPIIRTLVMEALT